MARVFAFPMSPANYTLDIIDNIYKPMGIQYAFVHGSSEASDKTGGTNMVLDTIKNPILRWKIIYRILRDNDVFIVNSYTEKFSLQILLLNIIFFKKQMGISSDTQLTIPKNKFRAVWKNLFLRWLFTRQYIYGLPGGTKTHVQLFTHFGMSESRVIVLPMMVNNDKYKRNEIPHPREIFKFIYIGRLVPCKQVDKVIEAFKSLREKGVSAELHIVGDGIERSRLQQIVDSAAIVFHGRLYGEALVSELHKADCLVLYSSREPWGLVVNEALASGIPCIVSDAVGARFDLIEGDNPTGITIPSSNVEKLCGAMKKIATDSKYWSLLSSNAVNRMDSWNYGMYKMHIDQFIILAGKGC